MTFWLDAHLPPDLAAWLGSRFGVIAKSLVEIGLERATDTAIFEAARRFTEIVIVTKDSDFADLVHRGGAPPQVVLLTIGNSSLIQLQVLLAGTFEKVLDQLQAGEALVEVAES